MQVNWDKFIAQYYPRFVPSLFGSCIREVQDTRHLSLEQFRFIVLGCGYYFEVRRPSSDEVVEALRRRLNGPDGGDIARFVLDERSIRKQVKEEPWLEIGPDRVRLSRTTKRGPEINPASKIAALTVDAWVKSRIVGVDPTELVCLLYRALSGRQINETTLNRRRKTARAVKAKHYDETLPMIEAWLGMLESRYKGFRRREDDDKRAERASVTMRLEREGIPDLYPINGWGTGVLRAVEVTVEPRRGAGVSFFS